MRRSASALVAALALAARYAARTGAPRSFHADPAPRAVDDEYAITVRRVRITGRG